MIYIGAEAEGGCGIYLDVHATERKEQGQQLLAIIGDGCYEGEVMISLGREVEITFVDALWGDYGALRAFFCRHGEERLRADLRRALQGELREDNGAKSGASRPHVYLPLFADSGQVAERWQ